ncbi:MAG: Ig-like domain-containing protein [Thermoplasmata archaeon]|nr:Ig-like domain-containing protein [Thermoplasmata archaeon]
MSYCDKCGNEFDDQYEFCTECGAKRAEPKPASKPTKTVKETVPPTRAPTRPAPDKGGSSKWAAAAAVIVVVIVVIALLAYTGILFPDNEDNGEKPPDTTAPNIAATDPGIGEMSVSVNPTFTIIFNEDMYQSTNIHSSLLIIPYDDESGEVYFTGDSSYWEDSKTVVIRVTSTTLDYNTKYFASLTYPEDYSVRDINGNHADATENIIYFWTFTTGSPSGGDTTPPTIVSTDPEDSATDVDSIDYIEIEFSEAMYQSTDIHDAFYLNEVACGYGCDWLDARTIQIELDDYLDYNTIWNAELRYAYLYNIKDPSDNYAEYCDEENCIVYEWTFTTKAQVINDTTPPYVISTDPYDDETNVDSIEYINITFSEPMYQSSDIHEAFYLNDVDWGYGCYWLNSTTVQIELDDNLNYDTTWNAELRYAYLYNIKDLNDNYAEYCDEENCVIYEWSFTTKSSGSGDTTPPYVVSTDPYDGELGVSFLKLKFTVTFNEPMYQSTNIYYALYLEWFDTSTENYTSSQVGVSSDWTDNKTVVIDLNNLMYTSMEYTASLRYQDLYDIKDINGNYAEFYDAEKGSIHEWTFTTE